MIYIEYKCISYNQRFQAMFVDQIVGTNSVQLLYIHIYRNTKINTLNILLCTITIYIDAIWRV